MHLEVAGGFSPEQLAFARKIRQRASSHKIISKTINQD